MITLYANIKQEDLEEALKNIMNRGNDDGVIRDKIMQSTETIDNIKEAKKIKALLKENGVKEEEFIERLKNNLRKTDIEEVKTKEFIIKEPNPAITVVEAKLNLDYERLTERMKPIETMEELEEVLDELDVKYKLKEGYCLIEFWTDTAGQNICYELDSDDVKEIIKGFTEYAEEYDVDDEVSIYENSRGENGVPDDYETLVADIKEAKETLLKIADRLNEGVKDEGRKEKHIERE